MKQRIKAIVKGIRDMIPFWRNWISFHATWEYISFFKYLQKQVFPFFKDNIYYPYDKNSTVWGSVFNRKEC